MIAGIWGEIISSAMILARISTLLLICRCFAIYYNKWLHARERGAVGRVVHEENASIFLIATIFFLTMLVGLGQWRVGNGSASFVFVGQCTNPQ